MNATPKELMIRLKDTFEANDTKGYIDCFSEDIVMEWPGSPMRISGKDQVREFWKSMEGLTGRVKMESQFEDGDMGMSSGIIEMDAPKGTHKSAFCDIIHVKDGKVKHLKSYIIMLTPELGTPGNWA